MPKRNDIVRCGDRYYRVLDFNDDKVLVIDCKKRTMPVLVRLPKDVIPVDMDELQRVTGKRIECFEKASVKRQNEAYKRFSLISNIIPFIDNKARYTAVLDGVSKSEGVCKQTIRKYLCEYLVFQNKACLLPEEKGKQNRALTDDEKNFRWALNRWFYNQNQHTLQWTYNQMLREKYCDDKGKLLPERPSFDQFRYFYRKTRSAQNTKISRNGLGDYQRNDRPLLGDCIQVRFPNIGTGMLDGTICDIYLVDDSGKVVGRPILTACIDANTALCCGYNLSWEGGTYSLRNLMLNTVADKVEWCKRHNIIITAEEWPCSALPGVLITDKGSEYIGDTFTQLTDLGVTLVDLEPFRPDLKPMVEKFFDVIQSYYKNELKGKGVVEKDFGERTNRTDYRKQARLTLEQFEMVLIRSIIYYNSQRTLENYPYSEEMLKAGISPTASGVWNFKLPEMGTNLIGMDTERLSLVLLPRTTGKFSREGLKVNGLRYVHSEGNYTDRYLSGSEVTVAYSPDNVSRVWLIEKGVFKEFRLIESRFKDMSIQTVEDLKERTRMLIKGNEETKLQGQIDLSNHIRNVVGVVNQEETTSKGIRETRQKEKARKHIEIGGEIR